MAIAYILPRDWIVYDRSEVFNDLVAAKAAVIALRSTPYQRDWVDELQLLQLKMEVAGTSQIEGAEFEGDELDDALADEPVDLLTRSQRQAKAAANTYRWISKLPDDRSLDLDLVREIHRRMITGCDDDHCEPGGLRGPGQNVIFGNPMHRGCEGVDCRQALEGLLAAMRGVYREHDPLLQAIAFHYHLAAMHPFADGNGRTARAVEALLLQRAQLRDTAFIAMSNYYYQEKAAYLAALAEVRQNPHDLTPFLRLSLRGVKIQCERLLAQVKTATQKAVFRDTMLSLFGHLRSPRKRVIKDRQMRILNLLLDSNGLWFDELTDRISSDYSKLSNPSGAIVRDVNALIALGATAVRRDARKNDYWIETNLDWPTQIRENDFLRLIHEMPKAKSSRFLISE